MSKQKMKYFMYGILVPYSWRNEWQERTGKRFYDVFDEYLSDDSFGNLKTSEGHFCISEGYNGKFIIIGATVRIVVDEEKPIVVPDVPELEKAIIKLWVKKHFDLEGEFNIYFITN